MRVLILAAVIAFVVACGGDGGPAAGTCDAPPLVSGQAATGNQFENPGLESGREPWCSLSSEVWGTPFVVSAARARSGAYSAALALRSEDGGAGRVYGVATEIAPDELPEVISGNYYVDHWEQGTAKQYLQFVVIVWGAKNQPEAGGATNYQIRYVLGGVDSAPLMIDNARYVLVGTGPPQQGQWVHFQRDIRQDFQELWQAVPEDFDRMRIVFEVRWDDRKDTDGASAADVYYDDLYAGPAAGAPN